MIPPSAYDLMKEGTAAFATGNANAAALAFAGAQSILVDAAAEMDGSGAGTTGSLDVEMDGSVGGTPGSLDVAPVSFPVMAPCDDLDYRAVFSVVCHKEHVSQSDIVLCAAAAKYNLAVSLQVLQGQQRDSLFLYRECLGVLNTLTWNGSYKAVSSLMVASLHNMAVILLNNQELQKAGRLVTLAERVLSTWSAETQLPLLDDETKRLFSLLQYFTQSVGMAPAA